MSYWSAGHFGWNMVEVMAFPLVDSGAWECGCLLLYGLTRWSWSFFFLATFCSAALLAFSSIFSPSLFWLSSSAVYSATTAHLRHFGQFLLLHQNSPILRYVILCRLMDVNIVDDGRTVSISVSASKRASSTCSLTLNCSSFWSCMALVPAEWQML